MSWAENLIDNLVTIERREVTTREFVTRGVETLLPNVQSLHNEMEGRRIRLYLGIDPTSPHLHIGHTVPLRKLRQAQELGHEVNLLFGTFTGMIGDPTDKTAARVRLTPEEIQANVATYVDQASRILDLSEEAPNPISIRYNHEWLGEMSFGNVIELASNVTVQQILERNMYRRRMEEGKPIYLHEFLYPLMQGQDAVEMDVDLEVGGKDQLFNMLVGRDLVQKYKGHEKWVMGMRLIEDPGGKKMGKTEGNIVNIFDLPEVKYEAVMLWPDTAIPVGFELVTTVPMEEVQALYNSMPDILAGKVGIGPLKLKHMLAYRVVSELDGGEEANFAREEFQRVKREGALPRRIITTSVTKGVTLTLFLVQSGLVSNENEALAKLKQGAIFVNSTQLRRNVTFNAGGDVVSVGKKTIRNVRLVEIV